MIPDVETPLGAALGYVRDGWPVFPCHTIDHGSCTCRRVDCASPGKHPRVRGGFHTASIDPGDVEQWWARWPAPNIGIATGAASGLVVVDIDPDHGADATLGTLVAHHGPLPETRTVRTGSGGAHLYFAHPGVPIRNDTGQRLGPGIDIRGDGGYILAPPSRHISGNTYGWLASDPIAQLPDWLLQRLRQPDRTRDAPLQLPSQTRHVDAWAHAALRREADSVAVAVEGTRNSTLNRAAFRLGQLVASSLLDDTIVRDTLLHAANRSGLGEREADATITSGLEAGRLHPRHRDERVDGRGVA